MSWDLRCRSFVESGRPGRPSFPPAFRSIAVASSRNGRFRFSAIFSPRKLEVTPALERFRPVYPYPSISGVVAVSPRFEDRVALWVRKALLVRLHERVEYDLDALLLQLVLMEEASPGKYPDCQRT